MKLNRRMGATTEANEIKALIEDMLVNGTGGDRTKWKRAFGALQKDKKMMKQILQVDENKAFEMYYMLGNERSLAAVSRKLFFVHISFTKV
jgi:hypothetical protein